MKRFVVAIMAVTLAISMSVTAHAASSDATSAADCLYELGLFSGTGTNADGCQTAFITVLWFIIWMICMI